MIAYTSGTTGRPKGAVHVHGGFLVKMASETAYQTDLHPDETLYWVTDMGWIMGPWEMVGRRLRRRDRGAVRGRARLARARPRVGVGRAAPGERARRVADADPRAARPPGDEHPAKHDLSSLRVFGSTGEPWNPEPYQWLSEVVGERPRADHQHLRRHRGRGVLPHALSGRGDQGVLARRRLARHGRRRVRPGRATRCAARSASSSASARGRA